MNQKDSALPFAHPVQPEPPAATAARRRLRDRIPVRPPRVTHRAKSTFAEGPTKVEFHDEVPVAITCRDSPAHPFAEGDSRRNGSDVGKHEIGGTGQRDMPGRVFRYPDAVLCTADRLWACKLIRLARSQVDLPRRLARLAKEKCGNTSPTLRACESRRTFLPVAAAVVRGASEKSTTIQGICQFRR